jgi:hypothetical protein
VEFVSFSDAWLELASHGIEPREVSIAGTPPPPGVLPLLELALAESAATCELSPQRVPLTRVPEAVDLILHKLHLSPVVVVPRSRWRSVFDAVTFTLAENRAWQEVESEATVILNTRDPLLCTPADLRTLRSMLEALVCDGRSPEESVAIIPAEGQLLIEVVPGAGARVEFSTQALADSVEDLLHALD